MEDRAVFLLMAVVAMVCRTIVQRHLSSQAYSGEDWEQPDGDAERLFVTSEERERIDESVRQLFSETLHESRPSGGNGKRGK